jgi:hypothetical protein
MSNDGIRNDPEHDRFVFPADGLTMVLSHDSLNWGEGCKNPHAQRTMQWKYRLVARRLLYQVAAAASDDQSHLRSRRKAQIWRSARASRLTIHRQ